jgi:hypothetical protein
MAAFIYPLELREHEYNQYRLISYAIQNGAAHAEELGLSKGISPPVDGLMGELMLYLQNFPATSDDPGKKEFLAVSSFSVWMAMHSLIKEEWIDRYKPTLLKGVPGAKKALRDSKPLGDVLQKILHLCEKSATVAHFGSYPERIGGSRLFAAIAKELARNGGVFPCLQKSYGSSAESSQSKRAINRDFSILISRIKAHDPPSNTDLFLGKLLAHAVARAEQSNFYKTTVFSQLIVSLRNYAAHQNAASCGLIKESQPGNLRVSTGKGAGTKKLFSRSLTA